MTAKARQARVRIECKAPAPISIVDGFYPIINGTVPSISDARVFIVTEDGTEHDISHAVESVEWDVYSNAEPAKATVRIFPDQVDLAAIAKITWDDDP